MDVPILHNWDYLERDESMTLTPNGGFKPINSVGIAEIGGVTAYWLKCPRIYFLKAVSVKKTTHVKPNPCM